MIKQFKKSDKSEGQELIFLQIKKKYIIITVKIRPLVTGCTKKKQTKICHLFCVILSEHGTWYMVV